MTSTTTRSTRRPSGRHGAARRARGVGKSYGNIRALQGVSLEVHAGEVTCVLGDNGAGKSTLIKIISGLHQHAEGELLVDGEDRYASPPRARPSTAASPPSTRTSPSCR